MTTYICRTGSVGDMQTLSDEYEANNLVEAAFYFLEEHGEIPAAIFAKGDEPILYWAENQKLREEIYRMGMKKDPLHEDLHRLRKGVTGVVDMLERKLKERIDVSI